MASSRKSTPEKKTKRDDVKTPNKSNKKKNISSKNQTSNGGASNGKARTAAPSSSSSSDHEAERGFEINQKPKSNGKREQKRELEESANKFPMERVKRIARSEDKEMRITHEAVFVVNKATEKFLERFCEEAYACCVQDRKKSLSYKHLSTAVSKRNRYEFLSDFVPSKVKAKDALAEIKSMDPESGS